MSKLLLIVLSLLLVFSCSNDSIKDPGIQFYNTIMPLALDNYWLFNDITYQPPYTWEEESKIEITGFRKVTYNGNEVIVFFWNWYDIETDTPQNRKTLVRNEEEGLYYYGQQIGSTVSDIRRLLFIKYPVSLGDEWEYIDGVSIKCISVSTTIETPLGEIDCYAYEIIPDTKEDYRALSSMLGINRESSIRNEEITYLYYKPEVGYVGMDIYEGEELVFKRRLAEFNVRVPEERLILRERLVNP
ncbi:MAG: hypothetical protein K0B81_06080 [Candidatus Cloacimonetes bacterium]|nr:hypothetical protein [Candidatus Cloacimonadota bacterium]